MEITTYLDEVSTAVAHIAIAGTLMLLLAMQLRLLDANGVTLSGEKTTAVYLALFSLAMYALVWVTRLGVVAVSALRNPPETVGETA